MDTKTCRVCSRELPIDSFYKLRASKDGFDSRCKECSRSYARELYRKDRVRILAKQKQYYIDRAERCGFVVPEKKICRVCKVERPIDDFYKMLNNKDGHHTMCKDCRSAAGREYYKENAEEVITRNKEYYHRMAEVQKVVRSEHYYKNKFRYKARFEVCKALKEGTLFKPSVCSICGEEKTIEGHHPDYDKPLEVIWVCRRCHTRIHGAIKRGETK